MHRERFSFESLRPWMVNAAGAAIAVVAAAGFYQGIYAPLQRDVDERTARIEQIRELSSHADQIAADHIRLVDRLNALEQAVRRTHRRMPKDVAAVDFVTRATALAEGLGLTVQQSQNAVPQHHPTHSTVEISYVLSGSYASMCRYLAAIDHLPQLSKVKRLEVERSPNSAAYPVQVTFQLYYQSQALDKDEQRGAL